MNLKKAFFEIAIDPGRVDEKNQMVFGWKEKSFEEIGIYKNKHNEFTVIHIESGYRILGFKRFKQARQFVFNIFHLTWDMPLEFLINSEDHMLTVNRAKKMIERNK